jgi:hypothetical protein
MAYKHQLSLEVPDTNNCSVFRIVDTSIYDEHVPVTCPKLEITSPGYNEPVVIDVVLSQDPTTNAPINFSYILNGCTLGIQTVGCGQISERLPDGIYTIKYSVSPNDKVFVEYHYLRTCMTNNKYFNELCKLEMAACEPQPEVKESLNELRLIKSFIDAAKAKVEQCDDLQQGMELLVYAQQRLQKYASGGCSTCH